MNALGSRANEHLIATCSCLEYLFWLVFQRPSSDLFARLSAGQNLPCRQQRLFGVSVSLRLRDQVVLNVSYCWLWSGSAWGQQSPGWLRAKTQGSGTPLLLESSTMHNPNCSHYTVIPPPPQLTANCMGTVGLEPGDTKVSNSHTGSEEGRQSHTYVH